MRAIWLITVASSCLMFFPALLRGGQNQSNRGPKFHSSDRCVACHNGLTTPAGQDVSIGLDWRSSIMANSSRDPYWQASVRRETIDHPESKADVENDCSICHMPIVYHEASLRGGKASVFEHLPFDPAKKNNANAEDGVSCSVCHQVSKEKLGTSDTFNGKFIVEKPSANNDHPEYGPFTPDTGHQLVMRSSTGGFVPTEAAHIRDSALCGSCHTLTTAALGPAGKQIGSLPEQRPYQEWLHSGFSGKYSCQDCHMPEVQQAMPITAVLGVPRQGLHQHTFIGGNFFMLQVLNRYRDELSVVALPNELSLQSQKTIEFLQSQATRVSIEAPDTVGDRIQFNVSVENLTGHKLPTAYPSRRVWLHVRISDSNGNIVFESGKLRSDGSIVGNDNDSDAMHYEPHYHEITSSDQVQIYEPILKDFRGVVTTGLLAAVGYLKDNRLLPKGFDKATADADIAVVGNAAADPDFTGGGDVIRYSVAKGATHGPHHILVELWYQPIGFRWAHNLAPYDSKETHRLVDYYQSMSEATAVVLARAEATR
ncbi:MAG TPA: hypothetical protein VG897_07025 [Terriglobales bacterium]|nr:hypothetical protein [Terriglobales bacterium]